MSDAASWLVAGLYALVWALFMHNRVQTERAWCRKAEAFMKGAREYDEKGDAAWKRSDEHLEEARVCLAQARELNLLCQKALLEGDKQAMERLCDLNEQSLSKIAEAASKSKKGGAN